MIEFIDDSLNPSIKNTPTSKKMSQLYLEE